MDQTYVLGPDKGGKRDCLYRYGNFCYVDTITVSPVTTGAHLARLLREMQAVQSKMKFISEVGDLKDGSDEHTVIHKLQLAMDFMTKQLLSSESVLAEALEDNDWIDAESSDIYFEFDMHSSYSCHNADIIIAKSYQKDVMMTVVYFQNRFTAALADASSEQNLVDSMLPTMHGRKHGFQVDSFDDPWFSKLSLWQGGGDDEESGGSGSGAGAGAGAAAASAAATATPTIDVAGEGYTQTYVVMKPKHLDQGSTARDVFFRFGNWCYSGAIDLGVEELVLGDVPEVLPALQKQQSLLAFTCETVAVPVTNPFCPILVEMQRALAFFEAEIIASEDKLSEMAELGITAWIEEDWGAAFFELSVQRGDIFKDVELIAGKRYSRGIVLHSVLFQGGLYAVLASADDDQPLLDVAFPDVTARCRGFQVKTYSGAPTSGLTPRRLGVWEGRRRGAVGVGWGTAAALAIGGAAVPKEGSLTEGMGLRKVKTRNRQEEKFAKNSTSAGSDSKTSGTAAAAAAASSASAPGGQGSDSKDAGGEGKTDDGAAAGSGSSASVTVTAAGASTAGGGGGAGGSAGVASDGKAADDAGGDGKEADGSAAGSGAGGGAGASAGLSSPSKIDPASYGVKAPHHLPKLGGMPKSRFKGLPNLKGQAPWDATGRPVLGKAVLK